MRFSTKSRYSLRLMIDLANAENDKYTSLRDISKRQNISIKYLEQIVSQLSKAGLLRSSRGPQGGYKLSRDASEYTPGDIIRAIEGKIAVVACLLDKKNDCALAMICPTLGFWEGMNNALNEYMDGITLREMADSHRLLGDSSRCQAVD